MTFKGLSHICLPVKGAVGVKEWIKEKKMKKQWRQRNYCLFHILLNSGLQLVFLCFKNVPIIPTIHQICHFGDKMSENVTNPRENSQGDVSIYSVIGWSIITFESLQLLNIKLYYLIIWPNCFSDLKSDLCYQTSSPFLPLQTQLQTQRCECEMWHTFSSLCVSF